MIRKISYLLLIALLAVSPLALAETTASTTAEPDTDASSLEALTPEESFRLDIISATEIYSWFVMTPLDVDENVPSPEGGMYLVLDSTLSQTSYMQERLDMYFSTEISQSLWAWGAYEDVNGWLYGYTAEESPYYRKAEMDIAGIVFRPEESPDEKTRVASVIVYHDDGTETAYRYVSKFVDEHWIFTEFPYFL